MPNADPIDRFTRANKAAWDASAHLHGQGPDWDRLLLAASQPGFNVLDACLSATLADLGVSGKSAVQIGCNNARELLSLGSMGAGPLLGLDQSIAFLAQAKQLAAAARREVRLIASDVYKLPNDLGQHDLALITIGVLNWMPDLPRFFQSVRSLMHPGATLVIYETHPMLEMFQPDSSEPLIPVTSYFNKTPVPIAQAITYDGSDRGPGETGYWFVHTLADIVTACVQSGMVLQRLQEHPHLNREADYSVYENQPAQMPLCYTLVAKAM